MYNIHCKIRGQIRSQFTTLSSSYTIVSLLNFNIPDAKY